jgi:hypothetical protein
MYSNVKQCRKCWQVKDVAEFSPRKTPKDKWICLVCSEKDADNTGKNVSCETSEVMG